MLTKCYKPNSLILFNTYISMRPCGSAQIELFVDQSFQKCTKKKKIKF